MDTNKVKYGLSNVYYAKATVADDGTLTYDKPVHIPGAVSLSLDAEGEITQWYADNIIYVVLNSNAGYSGDLEIALMPDDFAVDILHEELDIFLVMTEKIDQPVEHFALMFQFEGDRHAIRHVLYNCVCDRPNIEESTTEDTKEPQTDTLHIKVYPRADGIVKGRTSSQTPDNIFDGWFDEVYEPDGNTPAPTVTHTVRFYNGNTLLQTVEVEDGKDATYTGSTPVSPDDPTASFIGWEPEPKNVTSDMDCYAQFQYKTYSVEFWNGDTLLQTVQVKYGEDATYTGSTPVSPDGTGYVFSGWEPEPINVTSDMKCYAQYEERLYYVYFYNDTKLLQTVEVAYGGTAIYTGDQPTASDGTDRTFVGWEPEPTNIKEDTYCYAQFSDHMSFAVYCATDGSLTFYSDDLPTEGTTYNGKIATNVYTKFLNITNASKIPWYDLRNDILSITVDKSFAEARPISMKFWFSNCENCKSIDLTYINTELCSNMSWVFSYSRAIETINVQDFDTSSCVTFEKMFLECNSVEELDVSGFKTGNVENFLQMFQACNSLKEIDVSGFDMSNATNTGQMFMDCALLEDIDVSKFNTSNVTNMQYMFRGCEKLKSINVSSFNTENVIRFGYMFYNCSSLTELSVLNFNTSNAENMSYMFAYCSNLAELDITNFDTKNVTDFSGMFRDCSSLKTLDITKLNTSSATDVHNMFSGASNLETIDVSNMDLSNTDGLTALTYLFYGCSSLVEIKGQLAIPSSVTSLFMTFYGCSSLKTMDVSKINASNVTNFQNMFGGCTNLKTIYSDDSIFKVVSSQDISDSGMFSGCDSLVGGNGTSYAVNRTQNSTMAHIDTASNPGYFTDVNSEPYTEPVADSNGEIYDSWNDIIKNTDNGDDKYSVGQHKPLDLGDEGTVDMQIVSKNTDTLADGSGYATYTWLSEQLLKTPHIMNPWEWGDNGDGSNDDGTYNEGTGGIGGWEKCEMREYMKSTIWTLIPSNVRSGIKTVAKSQTAYNTSGSSFTQTTDDDIWIPSSNEMNTSNGLYRELYPDNESRAKNIVNTDEAATWWLRNSGGRSNYYAVMSTGGTGNGTSSIDYYYICLGFCT